MSNADHIAARLQELTSFIESAKTELNNGKLVNLSHLDDEVAQLCNDTLKLPPKEAAQMQPIMADMISKLEQLGLALKDFQTMAREKSKNGGAS